MRTGMPNFRLSRYDLYKEMVLYTEVISTRLRMLWPSLEPNYCVVFAQRS